MCIASHNHIFVNSQLSYLIKVCSWSHTDPVFNCCSIPFILHMSKDYKSQLFGSTNACISPAGAAITKSDPLAALLWGKYVHKAKL